jgi:predicted MFS family arabinose efflux permease
MGCVGSLLASSPLALLSQWVGWRGAFIVSAVVNAIILAVFLIIARDSPNGREQRKGALISPARPLLSLATSYNFWAISLSNFVRYGYFAALQSLWLGPFLFFGMGFTEVQAGNYLLYMGVAYMIGLPLWGLISDTVVKSRKKVVLPTMIAFAIATFSFTLWDATYPVWLQIGACVILGLCSSSGQVLYAHIKELNPPEITARALTSFNLFTMLGVGVMIHALGAALGETPTSNVGPERFIGLWYVGAIGLGIMSLFYSRVPDTSNQ